MMLPVDQPVGVVCCWRCRPSPIMSASSTAIPSSSRTSRAASSRLSPNRMCPAAEASKRSGKTSFRAAGAGAGSPVPRRGPRHPAEERQVPVALQVDRPARHRLAGRVALGVVDLQQLARVGQLHARRRHHRHLAPRSSRQDTRDRGNGAHVPGGRGPLFGSVSDMSTPVSRHQAGRPQLMLLYAPVGSTGPV